MTQPNTTRINILKIISYLPLNAKKILLFIFLPILVATGHAQSSGATDISATVKKLVTLIRTGDDAQAMKQLDLTAISTFILGSYYNSATEQQRTEFVNLFTTLFSRTAFPKIRETLKDLINITYDNPQIKGTEASIGSTVFIRHPLKTREMKLRYALVKTSLGWKVKDVSVLGDSMLQSIRNDQAQPVLKDGGMDALLKMMRSKIAGL
jgi:phospholipid transport system substrate-binding protein